FGLLFFLFQPFNDLLVLGLRLPPELRHLIFFLAHRQRPLPFFLLIAALEFGDARVQRFFDLALDAFAIFHLIAQRVHPRLALVGQAAFEIAQLILGLAARIVKFLFVFFAAQLILKLAQLLFDLR